MTSREALKLLGLSPEATLLDIKKQYRRLMHQIHPDASPDSRTAVSGPNAQELNLAYGILKRTFSDDPVSGSPDPGPPFSGNTDPVRRSRSASAGHSNIWNAPVNPHAFCDREILHYAEDCKGNPLGHFSIARGKYLWTPEEDFSLFLKSLCQCSKVLLDEADSVRNSFRVPGESASHRLEIQAGLVYLLAQQFLDSLSCLKMLAREESPRPDGSRIFRLSSMLELIPGVPAPKPEELLAPSTIRRHRLYLKNRDGKELGYLSFPDDRLYYAVIPLLEQRNVRIRILTAASQPKRKSGNPAGYRNLHLWIQIPSSGIHHAPENLNLQIAKLLASYTEKR